MVENKKYKVIAIHFTRKCNLSCPFCYRDKEKVNEKDFDFWYDLIPYLRGYTNQIALGGGEPFMFPEFIKNLSDVCKENKMFLNITTNGLFFKDIPKREDKRIKDLLRNVNMVSISIDEYKITKWGGLGEIKEVIKRLKRVTNCEVGINYLNTDMDFRKIDRTINYLNPNRIFLLTLKNVPIPNILKYKAYYMILGKKYNLFVDDLTNKILSEGKLRGWKSPCHYCREMLSIDEQGYVLGCSFDSPKNALLKLENPKDIKMIDRKNKCERRSCPYLKLK